MATVTFHSPSVRDCLQALIRARNFTTTSAEGIGSARLGHEATKPPRLTTRPSHSARKAGSQRVPLRGGPRLGHMCIVHLNTFSDGHRHTRRGVLEVVIYPLQSTKVLDYRWYPCRFYYVLSQVIAPVAFEGWGTSPEQTFPKRLVRKGVM